MGTVTTFDHTADVGLAIWGSDLDDLFRTAAEGLFDYIVANRSEVLAGENRLVRLKAETSAELLLAWLQELLFLCETEHRLFAAFDVCVAADGLSLIAYIQGEPIDPARHQLEHEVKAITQHGLWLRPQANGWAAEVILDI
jgi:SHS2 domain-containing protein